MRRKKSTAKKFVMISKVSERFDIHPQTLRMYEREGLITPQRSAGNTRLYDAEALSRLEVILTLTRDLGVNLAGSRSSSICGSRWRASSRRWTGFWISSSSR